MGRQSGFEGGRERSWKRNDTGPGRVEVLERVERGIKLKEIDDETEKVEGNGRQRDDNDGDDDDDDEKVNRKGA